MMQCGIFRSTNSYSNTAILWVFISIACVGCDSVGTAVGARSDYNIRADITAAAASTSGFRMQMSEHLAIHGNEPEPALAQEWASSIAAPEIAEAFWQTDSGQLHLVLDESVGLADNATLLMSPERAGDMVRWHCSSTTIEQQHMPYSC